MTLAVPVSLATARLVLRRPTDDDALPIFEAYTSDPEVTRFLTWTTHENVERAHAFLRRCATVWSDRSAFPWAITLRDDEVIGMIELRPEGHRAEIGYALSRAEWGRGYASEAARAVVEYALAQPSIHRVWAYVDLANPASARVLEKAGMVREGCLKKWYVPSGFGVPRDCWMYARVKHI